MTYRLYLFQPNYHVAEEGYCLPYSIGCLWSYVSEFPDIQSNFELSGIFFRRDPVDQLLDQLDNPDICGFSCHIWNKKYCLVLAEKIKERWPNCLIEFGGGQVDRSMECHTFIDVLVRGEGEKSFLDILECFRNGKAIPTWYDGDSNRLASIDYPSPYSLGFFDAIIAENPNINWMMIIETSRGCPYSCTFCTWGNLTGNKTIKFGIDRVKAEISWAGSNRSISYIFGADANFGIFKDRDIQIAKMLFIASKRNPNICSILMQHAKNSPDSVAEINRILGPLANGISFSVQSMNPETLVAIKRRNMDFSRDRLIPKPSDNETIPFTEIILGLPLETAESWRAGLCELLEIGQHYGIEVYFALLLANSELGSEKSRQKYGIVGIVGHRYGASYFSRNDGGIQEEEELIASTNTLSINEMVDSYMYGWMIMNFHIVGYSQAFSRYLRENHRVSFREYYDLMFTMIQDSLDWSTHYQMVRDTVYHYLSTGRLLNNESLPNCVHPIYAISYDYIYRNMDKAIFLAHKVASTFAMVPETVSELQAWFVVDASRSYPTVIELSIDPDSYQMLDNTRSYSVNTALRPGEPFDLYRLKRKGTFRNRFVPL